MTAETARPMDAPAFGVVVIGRNEGERLKLCLQSLIGAHVPIVYVDSGSTDGSQAFAESLKVEVLDLDMSVPFTAARARNAGVKHLVAGYPGIEYVQFVDGDCEIVDGWLEVANRHLGADPSLAAVCGRRSERFPENSLYNCACDLEWDTPIGEAMEFGGEVMMRVRAFQEVGGYNDEIIAAEDTDLAIRMRKQGWRIFRIEQPMSVHDAAILRFDQWWKRMVRGGHGTAENEDLHGDSPQFHRKGWARSTLFWGLAVPAGGAMLAIPTLGLSAVGATVGLGALFLKTERAALRDGRTPQEARAWAVNCTLGKVPEAVGHLRYWRNRVSNKRSKLIEYK
ncbi:MAG: glycosyltransferase [Myxococcales bacterium]|nr:glycosyltransferase [Myxococcales bacterium]